MLRLLYQIEAAPKRKPVTKSRASPFTGVTWARWESPVQAFVVAPAKQENPRPRGRLYNCSNLADLVTYKLLDPNVPQAADLG